jgi:hypothetical protein
MDEAVGLVGSSWPWGLARETKAEEDSTVLRSAGAHGGRPLHPHLWYLELAMIHAVCPGLHRSLFPEQRVYRHRRRGRASGVVGSRTRRPWMTFTLRDDPAGPELDGHLGPVCQVDDDLPDVGDGIGGV